MQETLTYIAKVHSTKRKSVGTGFGKERETLRIVKKSIDK